MNLDLDRLVLTAQGHRALAAHDLDPRELGALGTDAPLRRTAGALLVNTGPVLLVVSLDGRRLLDVRLAAAQRRRALPDAGCTAHRPDRRRRAARSARTRKRVTQTQTTATDSYRKDS